MKMTRSEFLKKSTHSRGEGGRGEKGEWQQNVVGNMLKQQHHQHHHQQQQQEQTGRQCHQQLCMCTPPPSPTH